MTTRIEVAVVIVNYCSAELTLRALASLAEEHKNPGLDLSVTVVENASGDEERLREGIASAYAHFAKLVVSPVNGGFGAGNNLGVRTLMQGGSRAKAFHFLNPDTVVHPGAVLALARYLEAHPRAGAVGSRFEHADGTPWPFAFRFPTPLGEIESGACLGIVSRLLKDHSVARELGETPEQVDWLSGASIMVRREMLESVGGFDETYFLYFEETDLCRRAKGAGWEIWYVPDSRVMHIRGQSTGVTALDTKPQRLPRYWFESRRRYYAKNHGLAYAAAADLAFLAGNGIGTLKNTLQGKPRTPNLLGDIMRHSVWWPQNRAVLPVRNTSVRVARGA
jgi:N-acetylglucosaminyl-diphospho-decaprenol L-rhamnosyltransferase